MASAAATSNSNDDGEGPVKQAADNVAFHDKGVPGSLYTLLRKQVHWGIQNYSRYRPEESGTTKWDSFCEWAAGHPTIATHGQLEYQNEATKRHVRTLCYDVAKKARNSRQCMWSVVRQARAAYRATHNGEPANIELAKWPLPEIVELGQPSVGPSYIPRNMKGKGGVTLHGGTEQLNKERARIALRNKE